ncbi:MAG: NAD(P)H-flavin reductase [Candidatus Lightella neohaematopini]|nr:NAD(P)H-flavin reductase [Candidatus Lightella neohaematopini]
MSIVECTLHSLKKIAKFTYRVRLKSINNITFAAGQYLLLLINNNRYPFSLASSPLNKDFIELHIGSSIFNQKIIDIISYISHKKIILVDIPYGNAWLRINSYPIMIIVGGTGFSYAQSILFTIIKQQPNKKIIFYWGVKNVYDFYSLNKLNLISNRLNNILIKLIVENHNNIWKNKTGTVLDLLKYYKTDIKKYDLYMAGPYNMITNIIKFFSIYRDIAPKNIFSDITFSNKKP